MSFISSAWTEDRASEREPKLGKLSDLRNKLDRWPVNHLSLLRAGKL